VKPIPEEHETRSGAEITPAAGVPELVLVGA
jgi:hypothetical protein